MKTLEMNVEQLRKRASELNIKNAKKFKKDELIAMINEKEEALKPKMEIDPSISKKQEFYDFVMKYKGVFDKSTSSTRVYVTFPKECYNDAVYEYKSIKKTLGATFYCYDKFLCQIVFARKQVKEKRSKEALDMPRGEQSLKIYKMLIEHPTWSHYKIRTILNCTYTNVRRVWLIYVKDKFVDQREFKTKKND
jgi:hypothetical protein